MLTDMVDVNQAEH